MTTINTILAEALDFIATELETAVADGVEFNAAVQTVLEKIINDHGAVVFNDDGYADEWQIEAAERGLPNLKTTLDALPELITEESMELFSHYGVFNHREMHSRYEIALEQYILSIHVEAALTLEMANTIILPAALRYQTELAAQRREPDRPSAWRPTPPPSTTVSSSLKALRTGLADAALGDGAGGGRHRGEAGRARPEEPSPGHGRRARRLGHAREPGRRRPVAAADLPGDALHPLEGRAVGRPDSGDQPRTQNGNLRITNIRATS